MKENSSKPVLVTQLDVREGDVHLRLAGVVDETAVFPELPQGAGRIHLDLSSVRHINSIGIRLWVAWTKKMVADNPKSRLFLERCSDAFVRQFALLPMIIPSNAEIQSVFAPMFCRYCNEDTVHLLTAEQVASGDHAEDKQKVDCPKCSSPLEAEILSECYLRLFKNAPHKPGS